MRAYQTAFYMELAAYQRIMLYDPVSAAFPRVETPSKPPRSPFSLDSGPLHPQTLTSPLSTDFGPF